MQLLIQHAHAPPQPPSARLQTARELARRLDAVALTGEWTPELAREWWDTHHSWRS